MSVRKRKDRPGVMVDIMWPDRSRTRVAVASEDKANEINLRARLSKIDGSWPDYREVVKGQKLETLSGRPRSFDELAALYLEQHVKVKNRSIAAKESFLRRFRALWGRLPLEAVRLSAVDRYISERKKTKVSNATINRELSCLRHMYSWAMRREFLDKNPLLNLDKLQEPQWVAPEATPEIVKQVFDKLDVRFAPIFVLIRETGARRGEVLGLRREHVDLTRRMVMFVRTKTGKARPVFLTDDAVAAIESMPEFPGCPYVFFNPATGTRWHSARKPWEAARAAAGYPWLRVRDLRIAFGTKLAEVMELETVAKVLGNSRDVAEKYYAKVSPEAASNKALRLLKGGKS